MFRIILPRFIFKVERWKWNKEYRTYVSNMGHFMDEHKKIIPIRINQNGYVGILTPYGFMTAHRLVMRTWRPTANMENLTVDHLDHNKRNNSVENLEWVTKAENMKRARADYFDENAKPKKEKKKEEKVKTIPRSYTLEKFYPAVNGYVFDDFQTAWWYCQEVVGRSNVKQCTLEGLENKFKSLLVCLQNNTDYITGKRKYTYCGNLELTLVLKED
jgi:hypothetical protein